MADTGRLRGATKMSKILAFLFLVDYTLLVVLLTEQLLKA